MVPFWCAYKFLCFFSYFLFLSTSFSFSLFFFLNKKKTLQCTFSMMRTECFASIITQKKMCRMKCSTRAQKKIHTTIKLKGVSETNICRWKVGSVIISISSIIWHMKTLKYADDNHHNFIFVAKQKKIRRMFNLDRLLMFSSVLFIYIYFHI